MVSNKVSEAGKQDIKRLYTKLQQFKSDAAVFAKSTKVILSDRQLTEDEISKHTKIVPDLRSQAFHLRSELRWFEPRLKYQRIEDSNKFVVLACRVVVAGMTAVALLFLIYTQCCCNKERRAPDVAVRPRPRKTVSPEDKLVPADEQDESIVKELSESASKSRETKEVKPDKCGVSTEHCKKKICSFTQVTAYAGAVAIFLLGFYVSTTDWSKYFHTTTTALQHMHTQIDELENMEHALQDMESIYIGGFPAKFHGRMVELCDEIIQYATNKLRYEL